MVWVLTLAVLASAVTLAMGLVRGREGLAFAGSAAVLFTLLGTGAAARWPILLRSTVSPMLSLDAHTAATSVHGLRVALTWTLIGLPLACAYFVFLAWMFRGKVQVAG